MKLRRNSIFYHHSLEMLLINISLSLFQIKLGNIVSDFAKNELRVSLELRALSLKWNIIESKEFYKFFLIDWLRFTLTLNFQILTKLVILII